MTHINRISTDQKIRALISGQQYESLISMANNGELPGDHANEQTKDDSYKKLLKDKKIILVEDEAMIAMEIEFELEDCGANIIGPIHQLCEALCKVPDIQADGAILDVNLNGEMVFPVADILIKADLPFVFHTGNASSHEIQQRYPETKIVKKPTCPKDLLRTLADTI